MSAPSILIRGGSIFTADESADVPVRSDLLIVDGIITRVGPGIDAPGAEVIDARGKVVLPGLIDTHRHLWQSALRHVATDWTIGDYVAGMIHRLGPHFTPADVYIANLAGSIDALNAGTTTVMDWSHIVHSPHHADAAVDALVDSGVRAVYGYGVGSMPAPEWYPDDLRRVSGTATFARADGRLSLMLASWGPEFADLDSTVRDLELARELGIRTSIHIGVGMLGAARSVAALDARGLLGNDLVFVHANTATDDELARIAATGGAVSVSARVEMQMGHGYPATGRLREAGLQPSLSVDVVSGIPGTMFDEMRAVLDAERARQNLAALDRGEWTAKLDLTAREVVEMATIGGARALGVDARTGSLTVGKEADIVVLDADVPPSATLDELAALIVAADARDVTQVLVQGERVKRDGTIVRYNTTSIGNELRLSRARLLAADHMPA